MSDSNSRGPYPSDLSDNQWTIIEPLIPSEKDLGRHRSTNIREVVNGINYRWSTGCVWRMLPHDFPPWATVYTYFRRWQHDGILTELRDQLISRRHAPRAAKSRRTSPGDTHHTASGRAAGDPQRMDPDRLPVSDQHPVPCV